MRAADRSDDNGAALLAGMSRKRGPGAGSGARKLRGRVSGLAARIAGSVWIGLVLVKSCPRGSRSARGPTAPRGRTGAVVAAARQRAKLAAGNGGNRAVPRLAGQPAARWPSRGR